MELLLVRHAIAEERDLQEWPDDLGRPLTRQGARKFRSVARILGKAWDTPDLVLSSPLARAWQTAQILEEVCGWPEPVELPSLMPGRKSEETIASLKKQAKATRVVLVGHEPSMHEILSHLLSGSPDSISLEMKKGGAALVRFDGAARSGTASLLWLLPPGVLLSAASH
jgi:phosphohistidine phosphatase